MSITTKTPVDWRTPAGIPLTIVSSVLGANFMAQGNTGAVVATAVGYLAALALLLFWHPADRRRADPDPVRFTDDGPVTEFQGEYRFLSNFWPAEAAYDGIVYPTSEHAYQAAKTTESEIREAIRQAPRPGDAKNHGAGLEVRPGWTEGLDVAVMSEVVASKFLRDPELKEKLLGTGDRILIEGNRWHDNNWGSCLCGEPGCASPGRNKLGQVLMAVRATLQAV